jgi:hypothetical protein
MNAWMTQYADWLEKEPVAVYARKMANYVGTNFDEQLLAIYMYLKKCAPPLNGLECKKKCRER